MEQRASGEFVHVELISGDVTIAAARKANPIYCAGLKCGLHEPTLRTVGGHRDLLRPVQPVVTLICFVVARERCQEKRSSRLSGDSAVFDGCDSVIG
jgi:hypothetical protein